MQETKIIAMPVPLTLATDIAFFAKDSGLFNSERDLVLHAIRQLYLDTYEGFDGELEEWMDIYRALSLRGETGRIEVEVPVGLFDAITENYPARGYGFSEFVCIALTRMVSFLDQYDQWVEENRT